MRVRNLGHFVCVLKFDSPLLEDHRVNILSTADSLTTANSAEAPPRSPAPMSTEDRGGKRVFITNVKGTFFGMSESEEASKRR